MPTANQIATFNRFSRDAVNLRVKRKGLSGNIDPREILMLIPLDEKHQKKISLEEARTEETIQSTELKKIQRQKLEGELAPVEELRADEARLLEGIAAIIRSSPIEDTRKEDIFSAIADHVDTWAKR